MPPKGSGTAEREAVKVAVRLRPMSSNEKEAKYDTIVNIDRKEATVYVTNPQGQKVNFKFDFAFPAGIPQEDVYDETAAPIVTGVLEGFNGTIFAYGQTGTGKTFSMDGKEGDLRGIMPRAFEHIFDFINANSDSHQFMVTVTYVEIYNDELRDLLNKETKETLKIREDPQRGIIIKGAAIHKVQCLEDLNALLNFGKKNRVVRKTNMNAESSRSHSILTLNIETLTQIEGGNHVRSARLNLVDLAGSERVAKTGAEGEGFKEGVNINYELMILGNCIAALTQKNVTHIPYRDSKLTMILRDSLGGNARTMMIAAIGPASYNFMETMSTLRYAERAKKIENKPKVNMDPKDALLMKYQEELAALQAQLNGTSPSGGGGSANGGLSQKSDEERMKEMEAKLASQRKQLESASKMAKEERTQLEKALQQQLAAIDAEKEKRAQYEQRLKELSKFAVIGDLKKKTEQNEAQIREYKERLKQRQKKAKTLQNEIEERQRRRENVIERCDNVQAEVQQVNEMFNRSVEQYQNLKLKLPEVQKQIQADREDMATNIDSLNRQIELYQKIIDNFIPEKEVENIRTNFVYNEGKNQWFRKEIDKKALVQKVTRLERPKSAVGGHHPQAQRDDQQIPTNIQLSPMPVKSRMKNGPAAVNARSIEDAISQALEDKGSDFEIDVANTEEPHFDSSSNDNKNNNSGDNSGNNSGNNSGDERGEYQEIEDDFV